MSADMRADVLKILQTTGEWVGPETATAAILKLFEREHAAAHAALQRELGDAKRERDVLLARVKEETDRASSGERVSSSVTREQIAQTLHEQRSKRYLQHPSLLKDCVPEYQRDTLGDAAAILALFAPQLAARDATIVELAGEVAELREENARLKTQAEADKAAYRVVDQALVDKVAQLATAERERDDWQDMLATAGTMECGHATCISTRLCPLHRYIKAAFTLTKPPTPAPPADLPEHVVRALKGPYDG